MARIIKSSTQVDALKIVNDGLKQIQKIDAALESGGGAVMSIRIGMSRVQVCDADFIRRTLQSVKRETVREVRTNSARYSIGLSKEEESVLGITVKEEPAEEGLNEEPETVVSLLKEEIE